MTTQDQPHLTDEQLFSLLDAATSNTVPKNSGVILSEVRRQPDAVEGPAVSTSTTAHLADCPHCQSELSTLRASLTHLRIATTAIAAANAPAFPPRLAAAGRSSAFFRPAWAMSFATAAALCVATLAYIRPLHTTQPAHNDPPALTASTAESDDALLNDIQRDLSTSVAPSLEPLTVTAR